MKRNKINNSQVICRIQTENPRIASPISQSYLRHEWEQDGLTLFDKGKLKFKE